MEGADSYAARAKPPALKGEPRFELTFTLDREKQLRVTARDLVTGMLVKKDAPVTGDLIKGGKNMEMQEMEITIDKEGRIQVKVNRAHGADCLAMTKNLEEAAGVVEERAFHRHIEQPMHEEHYTCIRRY